MLGLGWIGWGLGGVKYRASYGANTCKTVLVLYGKGWCVVWGIRSWSVNADAVGNIA